jgi:hypothetical protein
MSEYKPNRAKYDNSWTDNLGWLATEFEPFEPNSKYTWQGRRMPSKDAWKIMVPRTAPPVGDIPRIIEKLIESTWKFTEPSANAVRGNISIGTRGGVVTVNQGPYHAQVRPTASNITTAFPNKTAIASDWKLFEQIPRTNAVTFRGDTRPPVDVIAKANGFHPPISRTDRYYLENNIFNAFAWYLNERYQRTLTQAEFLQAVNTSAPLPNDKNLLIDYLMWRKICEREAVHLGRMVENECLKGYISTSRSVDTGITFGTGYNKKPGWLYVTVIHSAFVVPWGQQQFWGSEEAEVAQWGAVPSERIVGFMKLDQYGPAPGPIFFRRSFRKEENAAFEYMFNVMSGMLP